MANNESAEESVADADTGGDAASATDSEVPWRDVTDSAAGEIDTPPPASDTKPTEVIAGTTAVIEPAVYCEQCPQFDDSAGECANADTIILEPLHDGRFHVANCPVVTADGPEFDGVQRD